MIEQYIDELSRFEDRFLESSKNIFQFANQKMYSIDFMSLSINNRSIELVKGFELLVKNDYYLCAIPLIRLQLDNALRFYATFLVSNLNDFISHFMSGKPIKDYKDSNNKNLSDNYLAKKMDLIFPGVFQIYTNLSGHVHLSDQHLFAAKIKSNDGKSRIKVGGHSDNLDIDLKISFVKSMIDVSNLVLIILGQWEKDKKDK